MRGKLKLILVFALLAAAATAAIVVAATRGRESERTERQRELAHILKSGATPGRFEKVERGGEASREIANGPAQEEYANEAYPYKTIAFAQTDGARRADDRLDRHHGRRLKGRWESIGPDTLDVDTLGQWPSSAVPARGSPSASPSAARSRARGISPVIGSRRASAKVKTSR
jgi:hypothetical protein